MARPRRASPPLAWLACGLALTFSGCASPTLTVSVPRIERFLIANPQATPREIDRALSERAKAHAATLAEAQSWRGRGLSMEPLIPAESWIVTERIPYTQLRPGQVVLYRNRSGHLVAHALVKLTRQGWLTVGVNNDGIIDPTPVTLTNYIGIVTAAFTASPPNL